MDETAPAGPLTPDELADALEDEAMLRRGYGGASAAETAARLEERAAKIRAGDTPDAPTPKQEGR